MELEVLFGSHLIFLPGFGKAAQVAGTQQTPRGWGWRAEELLGMGSAARALCSCPGLCRQEEPVHKALHLELPESWPDVQRNDFQCLHPPCSSP